LEPLPNREIKARHVGVRSAVSASPTLTRAGYEGTNKSQIHPQFLPLDQVGLCSRKRRPCGVIGGLQMLRRTITLASIAFVLSFLTSTVALAAAQRTFVASNGNDANPCSLVLPCRSFASAIAQTISGGEVIVLDSAGYGPVTITQSVSIIAPAGIYAGISVPSNQMGVTIATPGVDVVLQGLTMNTFGGQVGVFMTDGASLRVDDCVISNFVTGVSVSTNASVTITGTTIQRGNIGISLGNGAAANVRNSQILLHVYEGVVVYGADGPPPSEKTTSLFIVDSLVSGTGSDGSTNCIDNNPLVGIGNVSATRLTVNRCANAFINGALDPAITTTVGNSMVTGNSVGFHGQAGAFQSLGNNQLSGNTTDTVGTITTIGGK
jgi:hypothetical protein